MSAEGPFLADVLYGQPLIGLGNAPHAHQSATLLTRAHDSSVTRWTYGASPAVYLLTYFSSAVYPSLCIFHSEVKFRIWPLVNFPHSAFYSNPTWMATFFTGAKYKVVLKCVLHAYVLPEIQAGSISITTHNHNTNPNDPWRPC